MQQRKRQIIVSKDRPRKRRRRQEKDQTIQKLKAKVRTLREQQCASNMEPLAKKGARIVCLALSRNDQRLNDQVQPIDQKRNDVDSNPRMSAENSAQVFL